jgi:hypothetical protein
MADQEIKFILEAVDNASAKIAGVGESIDGLSSKAQLALVGIGAAATAALGASVIAAAEEEAMINKAALATADAAGGFDKAKAAITQLNAEMEAQGFQTKDTVAAFSALVTKAGQDVPTALKNTADMLAYSELPNNSLMKSVKMLAKEEGEGFAIMEGSGKKRMENADITLRMAIAQEKFGNILERVGQKLMPLAEAAISFATTMMDAFDKLDPVIQDIVLVVGILVAGILALVGAIVAIMGPLMPFITAAGGLVPILTSIAAAIGSIIAVVASFLTGIGEILLIIAVIVAALAVFKAAWDNNFMGIRELLTPFIDWFQQTFSKIENILLIPLMPLLLLKLAFDENLFGIKDLISNFILDIQLALQTFIDNVLLKWLAWLANLVLGIVDFGVKVIAEVNKFVAGITTAFEGLIKKGLEWGAQLVANVLQGISDKAKEIGDAVGNAASSAWDVLSGGTSGATGLAASGVRPLAAGGIITSPTMALLGEGGENEYVIPESKLGGIRAGGGPQFILNLNVEGNIDEKNREMVINTVQQEFATLWRSVSR